MSCHKRKPDEEEREKGSPCKAKRACFQEGSPSSQTGANQLSEKNVRVYSDAERQRILSILETEFDNELQAKEDEIMEVQERIIQTQRILQYLCYAVVSDFYSREKTITSVASTRQRRIHPAVKKLLSGKGPPGAPDLAQNVTIPAEGSFASSSSGSSKHVEVKDNDVLSRSVSPVSCESVSGKDKKVPRYIPPKPKLKPNAGNVSEPIRGGQNKVKTILVVGNVSKWLPPDSRDDAASHKWMVYIRGPKGAPNISSFVSKVRFFLHPSYRPNDVVQVVCPPFQLSRRGWGEFPIRVQVHFSNSLNKPVDIIHNLKLDRTYSGLQTLGSETVAEVWIHREQPTEIILEEKPSETTCDPLIVKTEPVDEIADSSWRENEMTISTSTNLSSSQQETSDNLEKDAKNSNPSAGKNSRIHLKQTEKEESPSKKIFNSVVAETNLIDNFSAADKIKLEPLERERDLVSTDVLSSSLGDSKQRKPLLSSMNVLLSPTKAILTGSSTTTVSQTNSSVVCSPSKLITNSSALLSSPTKPGTQLVKCVDSQGKVRLLQVRTDVLPKILRKGTATISTTPPAAQENLAKPIAGTPRKESSSQLPVPQNLIAAPETLSAKVVPQTTSHLPIQTTAPIPIQTSATPATLQATTKIILPSSKVPVQSSQTPVKSQPSAAQSVLQVPPQTTPKVVLTSPVKIQGGPRLSLSPGAGPVLRLVRPAGNANVRPMLVPASSANQQIIRLPAAAAANGSRPLYVLKDGKLFMMKSALGAAAGGSRISSAPTLNVASVTTSASLSSQDTRVTTSATVPSTSSKSLVIPQITTAVNQLVKGSSASALVTASTPESKGNEGVPVSSLGNQPMLTINPTVLLKPRSLVAAVPTAVRMSVPKSSLIANETLQTANKANSLLAQRLPPHSSSSTPTLPRLSVKSGKSLLKPAVSLLKSNMASAATANKSSSSAVSLLRPPLSPSVLGKSDVVTANKRIILGRTTGSSSITTTSQQALTYREVLKSVVKYCPNGGEDDVWRAVRWMIRNLPLINSEAKHPEFKILHPYSAPNEEIFCSWNIGKQRACEWLRAKIARSLLRDAGWDLQNVWTTREIVLWARFHGYTPGLSVADKPQPRDSSCGGDCVNPIATICAYGEIAAVEEWLTAQERSSSLSSASRISDVTGPSDESEEEIDIVSSGSPLQTKIKQEPGVLHTHKETDEMPLEPHLHSIGDIVLKSLKRLGLRVSSEEIVPGVHYPAAHRMLIQAVQSLAEDLSRRAFSEAWGRDISRRPRNVEPSNVCSALCHRPEFDLFTCAGLGVKAVSDSIIDKSSKKI
ncbi:YEATS domain-containing protein 2 [Thrips palmi]|uniref:YEATS domain-containing protein 2 n=1 Tax=Thrips palmi TaxID=161013 RepID=A0A6P9AFM2_THRPL|nr:YEATS domain-containing protein 2 [Thrips palmi]XP_034257094.1 YEATS domain-containing protein 2 [Thrips palmi]